MVRPFFAGSRIPQTPENAAKIAEGGPPRVRRQITSPEQGPRWHDVKNYFSLMASIKSV
jgi:hypothetical protein